MKEGLLIREAVNASIENNIRTPDIQIDGAKPYGTTDVGEWITNYINK
jgi:3-isopropylmalate dehydrogenase